MNSGNSEKSKHIYHLCVLFYWLFCFVTVLAYGAKRDSYHLFLTLGALLMPIGILGCHKALGLMREYTLDAVILGFIFLAYPLGSCVDLYKHIPGFDKLAHMLSGVLAGMLALCLFCIIKGGKPLSASDRILAILFVLFGSIASAGLWEIGEYFVHIITGRDVQKVAATGINDTMQDMIVCLIGTILYMPSVVKFFKSGNGILNQFIARFVEKNAQRLCNVQK